MSSHVLHFFKAALRDYRMVGAPAPSSFYVAERIARLCKPHYQYVVEYGAGTGVVTEALLSAISPEGSVVAIEMHPDFVTELRRRSNARLRVIEGDVVALSKNLKWFGLPRIDAVVSGIPFSFLAPEARRDVVSRTQHALAPGGRFIVYQSSPLILPILKTYFPRVRLQFEPRNFFPYFIMVAEK